MIAALPMYDWPEERACVDALWAQLRGGLRTAGFDAPRNLTRDRDLVDIWTDPDLILGMACGLPYSLNLHDRVGLVGALDPKLPDTPAGNYVSVIVVRAADTRPLKSLLSSRVAVNARDSQSGWGALAEWARTSGEELGETHLTGSHEASARSVATGTADIASLDAVTWKLVKRHRPEVASRLRVATETAPTPALPLITARRFDVEAVANAVSAALGPRALVRFRPKDYLDVPRLPFPEAV